ncbi:MAG TPA: alpha/beta hydrolase [Ktedonobacteraceae bacterium]|jgi:hypothetical protein|nr:alpha/beta hydrolase [Ktedonobacteraceae bacterium]
MSTTLIIMLALVGIVLLTLLITALYFYRLGILRQSDKGVLAESSNLDMNQLSGLPSVETLWVEAQPFEDITMKSYDGLVLRGYYLSAEALTTKTVILAHGYNGHAKDMALLAQLYHETFGYNVLMPDNRGHGHSEGSYIGLGWHDRLDYVKWIDYVIQRIGPNSHIVLHGVSMGGATVLMTSGEPLPKQVKCVISDCAYTSATDILSYQLRRKFKLPAFPLLPLVSLICKLHTGYFFNEASALKQVARTRLPILFIHGEEDVFVPTEMIHPLYNQSQGYKEKLLIANAGHSFAYKTAPDLYTRKIQKFLKRFMG